MAGTATDRLITSAAEIVIGIAGLALLAVLISGTSNTSNVITAIADALRRVICVATGGTNCGGGGGITLPGVGGNCFGGDCPGQGGDRRIIPY